MAPGRPRAGSRYSTPEGAQRLRRQVQRLRPGGVLERQLPVRDLVDRVPGLRLGREQDAPDPHPGEPRQVGLEHLLDLGLGHRPAEFLDEQVALQAGREVLGRDRFPLEPGRRLLRAGHPVPQPEVVGRLLEFLVRDGQIRPPGPGHQVVFDERVQEHRPEPARPLHGVQEVAEGEGLRAVGGGRADQVRHTSLASRMDGARD